MPSGLCYLLPNGGNFSKTFFVAHFFDCPQAWTVLFYVFNNIMRIMWLEA